MKQKIYRKNGELYKESPVALTWDDENYYLITYKPKYDNFTHYRVDKMTHIEMTGEPRYMDPDARKLSSAAYGRNVFGMFGRETTSVRMRFHKSLVGVIIDRFGTETMLIPDGDEHFVFTVNVAVSPMFLSWVIGFGSKAKILFPQFVVEQCKQMCLEAMEQY